jgi:hypothetical protein
LIQSIDAPGSGVNGSSQNSTITVSPIASNDTSINQATSSDHATSSLDLSSNVTDPTPKDSLPISKSSSNPTIPDSNANATLVASAQQVQSSQLQQPASLTNDTIVISPKTLDTSNATLPTGNNSSVASNVPI